MGQRPEDERTGLIHRISKQLTHVLVLLVAMSMSSAVFSNPSLGNVAQGNVSVSQAGSVTTIKQTSNKAIVNWNSFDIAKR